ncbi:hypothetical protein [Methanobacterium sp.]|uniref:hypothetical protein n=1 Tax=Methanobacterium sp. TaxID=2164 RepID=UPI002AB857A1|nr:hypothetical protein [Methanobacterium sp.]MDY9922752.1 hypothetical protein [Methanobacterium sp.]
MAAICPGCEKQGKEIDFNVYKCGRCGIQWAEPVKKASLTPTRPGWFVRNHRNLKRIIQGAIFLIIISAGVVMALKPLVI